MEAREEWLLGENYEDSSEDNSRIMRLIRGRGFTFQIPVKKLSKPAMERLLQPSKKVI